MTRTPISQPRCQSDVTVGQATSAGQTVGPQIIVAMTSDRAIGRRGNLIYRVSADMKRFKAMTMGHAVIMGRKTWQSLPGGALPGRRNIVVSRNGAFVAEGAETATSVEQAIAMACEGGDLSPMIIGGGEIYAHALPVVNRVHVTLFDTTVDDADTWFEPLDPDKWDAEAVGEPVAPDDERGIPGYQFICYSRK